MPHPSLTLLVLHGLRLKHIAEPDAVAAMFGLDRGEVDTALKGAEEDDLVQRRDGQLAGWRLLPAGRVEHDRLLAAELDASGARAAIEAAYDGFLDVNPELLSVCTAWQLRDGVVNDHADDGYDGEVVDRLGQLHEKAQPIVADLVGALDRFGGYPARLHHAIGQVRAGATDWFTRPLFDSYHTVWFELHEDLLSTLGLERGAESMRSG